MSKLPLKTRKSLKDALVVIEANVAKAAKVYGGDIVWEDPSEAIYEALTTYGKTAEQLFTIGDNFKQYVDQFVKEITVFCKDEDNKEQLTTEWSTGILSLRVTDDAVPFRLEDGKLIMETKANYWCSYLTEFTAGALEKILGLNDPMPLIVKKNVKKNQKLIEGKMAKVSKVYGQELTWADNAQDLYEARKNYGASESDHYTLGDAILLYVNQLESQMTAFCKDADNLEALKDELAGGQVGVRIKDDASDKAWVIEDGNLWMETKANYWKSYLTEFSAPKL
jgi:hypothetical protein